MSYATRGSLAIVLTCVVGSQALGQAPVEVVNPKASNQVEGVTFVEGRQAKPGKEWPVVLVKSLDGGPWWIQQPVGNVDKNGVFQGEAHFGRPNMDVGVKFAIVIVLERDETAAKQYRPGDTVNVLPNLPQSMAVIVQRK